MSLNVLVTAASRRVGLVQGLRRALDALRVGGSVIGTDINALSPAVHFCDRAYRVPLSSDPAYLDVIARLCDAEHVSLGQSLKDFRDAKVIERQPPKAGGK